MINCTNDDNYNGIDNKDDHRIAVFKNIIAKIL